MAPKRVYFNFEEGPIEGSVNMGVVWEGGFDKENSFHIFCLNLQQILEERMTGKGYEVVNGEDVVPTVAGSDAVN